MKSKPVPSGAKPGVKSVKKAGKGLIVKVSKGPMKVYSRSKLVGKFPEIKHVAAPTGGQKLDAEDRRKLLLAMRLV